MAQPLYIWIGNTFDVGQSYVDGTGSTAPHESTFLDDQRYDFGARLDGVGDTVKFPGAPGDDSYAPRVWNHDDIHGGTNSIVTISAANPCVIECSKPHGRTAGATLEIHVSGVTGASAASINGTWTATAVGTHSFSIPLNSTSLTLLAISATVRQPGWSYYMPSVPDSGRDLTSDTDPSIGGAITDDETEPRRWGAELALLADLHDRWGSVGSQPHFLALGADVALMARESLPVSAATAGTSTVLTVDASALRADLLDGQPAVLWGFVGDWADLNGPQTVRYVSATSIAIDGVDTSGADPYPGNGRIVLRPRLSSDVDGEAFDDFTGRLADAVDAAADAGVSLTCKGIVLGVGRREQGEQANDAAEIVSGLDVESVSTDGYPVVVTLSGVTTVTADTENHLPLLRLRECGALDGVHEIRDIDGAEVTIHATNSSAIDTTNATADIGDPSWFFAEDLPELVAAARSAVAAETSDTAADIPVLLVQPRVTSGCEALAYAAVPWASCAAHLRVANAIDAVHAPSQGVSVIQTDDLAISTTANSEVTPGAALAIGHRVYAELIRQESRSTAYGTVTRRGVPVYVLLGDDYTHGGPVSYLTPYYDGNQDYDGSQWFGRGINIWDQRLSAFSEYTGVDRTTGTAQPGNANTHPTWNLNPGNLEGGPASIVGCEQSLLLRLRARHSEPIYVVKLGVNGSAITDSTRSLTVIGHTALDQDDNGSYLADLTLSGPHGRYDYTASVLVTVSGLSSVGIPNGVYPATPQSPSVLRIELASASAGGLPAAGAGSVLLPRPDWRKASADIWPAMTGMRDSAFAAIRATGRVPDVRAVFIGGIGLNDALYGVTADYQAALVQLFADIRDEWTTRSAPTPALPIVLGKVRTSAEYPGGAATSVFVSAVQTAQDTVCTADAAAAAVSTDAVGFNSDDHSLTWDGLIDLGNLLNTAYDSVDQSCSAVEGSHITTIPDSTFVT